MCNGYVTGIGLTVAICVIMLIVCGIYHCFHHHRNKRLEASSSGTWGDNNAGSGNNWGARPSGDNWD